MTFEITPDVIGEAVQLLQQWKLITDVLFRPGYFRAWLLSECSLLHHLSFSRK